MRRLGWSMFKRSQKADAAVRLFPGSALADLERRGVLFATDIEGAANFLGGHQRERLLADAVVILKPLRRFDLDTLLILLACSQIFRYRQALQIP